MQRRYRIVLICGGAYSAAATRETVTGADIVVYIDVPEEIGRLAGRNGAIRLTVADGMTVDRLLRLDPSKELAEFLRSRPAVDLASGLGQLRALGHRAARQLLAEPRFQEFMKWLHERLLGASNGGFQTVDVITVASGAGGCGSATSHVLGSAVTQDLLAQGVNVALRFHRAGDLSFVGLGPRLDLNTAATLAEDLCYVLSADRHEREVRHLLLTELPMVRGNKQLRDAAALLQLQALYAPTVREELLRTESNLAIDSPLGTVRIVRFGQWHGLDDQQVAAEVASTFAETLNGVLAAQAFGVRRDGVEITLHRSTEGVSSVVELNREVRDAQGVLPSEFMERCTMWGSFEQAAVGVLRDDGTRLELDNLQAEFPLCTTVEQYQKTLATLRSVSAALHVSRKARERELTRLRKAFRLTDNNLKRLVRKRLFSLGTFDRFAAFLGSTFGDSDEKVIDVRFPGSVQRVRDAKERLDRAQAELDAIQTVHNRLRRVRKEHEERLRRLLRKLETLLRPDGRQRLVDVGSIDPILHRLILQSPTGKELVDLLVHRVRSVTLYGLSMITGAKDHRFESIAAQVTVHPPPPAPHQSPWWGGRELSKHDRAFTVLPPVEDSAFQQLVDAVHHLDGEMILARAATAEGGLNVVRIDTHVPTNLGEIVTPRLHRALEKAFEEKVLYCTDGGKAAAEVLAMLERETVVIGQTYNEMESNHDE